MPKTTAARASRYAKQRPKLPAPVVTIATLRKAKGMTLQAVCDHIHEEHGLKVDRGTVSAIELGHRGASAQMLAAIADALGVHVMDIDTAYEPRRRREACEDVPA
ncbi:helix-turn-helix domain-containing protein [Mycobacterium timonense]|uniref:helix-turn-helix domain-containing protein n=1 Tax=Mycobacterium timonense TaxID=701043 RepID=UPI001B803183|nr:helix-turn-helix transcriptional regulator [Mycobacterium timonense]